MGIWFGRSVGIFLILTLKFRRITVSIDRMVTRLIATFLTTKIPVSLKPLQKPMTNSTKPSISWATTVWNEADELRRLLDKLFSVIQPDDEVVVQGDQGKVTDAVVSVLHKYRKNPQFKYVEYPLKRDFSAYKNNLIKACSKDWIVNLDADEMFSDELFFNIRDIIADNPDVDLYRFARLNIVDGLSDEHIAKWHWKVDAKGRVNFPDRQSRCWRNDGTIWWRNAVHEVLTGFKRYADLPDDDEYCIWHVKTIERQVKQNDFYTQFA